MDIDAVVQERINNDTDFQATLATLPEEERDNAINTKKSEVIKTEFESLSKKAQENEQKFRDQKLRAEKAEELAKGTKKEEKVESSITAKDVLVLTGAGYTHEEDIDTIERWAKFNNVGISEAIKDNLLKSVLATKQEERKTAQVTQTNGGARGVKSPSIDTILSEASQGKIPEKDTDIENLALARMAKRKSSK